MRLHVDQLADGKVRVRVQAPEWPVVGAELVGEPAAVLGNLAVLVEMMQEQRTTDLLRRTGE